MNPTPPPAVPAPYPGLRPFDVEEADIFFGRGVQIDQMLAKLEERRFLAVVGASGSGKSSLVRAGLLPALARGFLGDSATDWRFLILRPAGAPFLHLAEAVHRSIHPGPSVPEDIAFTEVMLRQTPHGLFRAIDESGLLETTHVLVLVDQFEELFRFRHRDEGRSEVAEARALYDERNEAAAFVQLLLATAREVGRPIFVVLTMRSDYIGDCDAFQGLPEAMNESQYLTSRLTRDQLKAAIVGPLPAFQAQAEPALVTAILNDVGNDPDQLPLMQHALRRTWELARARVVAPGETAVLRLADYQAIGGLGEALSRHADEVHDELGTAERKRVAEVVFRSLATRGPRQRLTRRIASVGEIAEIAGVDSEVVMEVSEAFARPDRSFLRPSRVEAIQASSLDISHESILRQWTRLRAWLESEADAASNYQRLVEQARRWKDGNAALLRSPDLDLGLKWRTRQQPTAAWARRYGGDLDLLQRFLDDSRTAQRREQNRKRRFVQLSFLVVLIFSLLLLWQQRVAKREARRARDYEGQAWLGLARVNLARGDTFAALTMAGRAIGFSGFGLEEMHDPAFAGRFPVLLAEKGSSVDPASVRGLLSEILLQGRGGLPLWRIQTAPRPARPVNALAFSLDGRRMATGSDDGQVRIWNVGDSAPRFTFPGGTGRVAVVSFSVAGDLVGAASASGHVQRWDLTQGRRMTDLTLGSGLWRSFAFSPDVRRLAVGGDDGSVVLWDLDTATRVKTDWKHSDPVWGVAFTPEGDRVWSASWDDTLGLWQPGQTNALLIVTNSVLRPKGLSVSSDGRFVACGCGDHVVRLWSAEDGELVANFSGHSAGITSVTFSPDGTSLASGSLDRTVRLWDRETQTARAILSHNAEGVGSVAFAPDGMSVASGYADGTVTLWETGGGTPRFTLHNHDKEISSVALSPDGRMAASGADDNTVKLWETTTGRLLGTFLGHTNWVTCVAFSRDNRTLASSSEDQTIRIWDLRNGRELESYRKPGQRMRCVAFNPADSSLASGADDGSVVLWTRGRSEPLESFAGHSTNVLCVAFSPDGQTLISGARDGTLRGWKRGEREPAFVIHGHSNFVAGVAFHPDGRTLASGSWDETVKVWQLASRRLVASFLGHRGGVSSVAFTPDGRTLASGSWDSTLRLWQVGRASALATLSNHTHEVSSVAFSPRGGTLASASWDKTVKLWDVDPGRTWNLAGYLQNWVSHDKGELVWLDPNPQESSTNSGNQIVNPPPGSLLQLDRRHPDASERLTAALPILMHGGNWPAVVALWHQATNGPATSPTLRRLLVAGAAATASDDLSLPLAWRARQLTQLVIDACTVDTFEDPPASLALMRLTESWGGITNAALVPSREHFMTRLRSVAPPTWIGVVEDRLRTAESAH